MSRKQVVTFVVAALALLIAVPVYALPGKPDFGEHVYVHGEAWGTKATAVLPAPNGNNADSFDILYVFPEGNAAEGQLLVGTSAPGDTDYNGGRWETWTATWVENVPHDKVVLTSFEQKYENDFTSIEFHYMLGHITLEKGSPGPPPPDYFECPLLPVKE